MILFTPEHKNLILNGFKNQTRRVWKKERAKVGSIHQARTQLFGKPFAHLKILGRYKEQLGIISEIDCIKEGQYTKETYKNIWIKINGSWNPELIVDVVEFEVIKL